MDKKAARIRRATKARKKMQELNVTRLVVTRTLRHIYAQIIAPSGVQVLAAASTAEKGMREKTGQNGGNIDAAKLVGEQIAKRALEKGIQSVAFDRSGFRYHGRVAALAVAARDAGLQF